MDSVWAHLVLVVDAAPTEPIAAARSGATRAAAVLEPLAVPPPRCRVSSTRHLPTPCDSPECSRALPPRLRRGEVEGAARESAQGPEGDPAPQGSEGRRSAPSQSPHPSLETCLCRVKGVHGETSREPRTGASEARGQVMAPGGGGGLLPGGGSVVGRVGRRCADGRGRCRKGRQKGRGGE